MRWGCLLGLVAVVGLAGCTSEDEFAATAIDQARATCEEQGKEFVLKDDPKVQSDDLMAHDVEIEGACIGPGEPGYVPPKK